MPSAPAGTGFDISGIFCGHGPVEAQELLAGSAGQYRVRMIRECVAVHEKRVVSVFCPEFSLADVVAHQRKCGNPAVVPDEGGMFFVPEGIGFIRAICRGAISEPLPALLYQTDVTFHSAMSLSCILTSFSISDVGTLVLNRPDREFIMPA